MASANVDTGESEVPAESRRADAAKRGNSARIGPSRSAIWIAVIAAVVASVGDFGLLYVGQQDGDPTLGWPAPPPGTLALSQWLGVLSIPLFAAGYISLARGLTGHPRTIVFWSGIYTSALGGVVHGLTGLAIRGNVTQGRELESAFSFDPAVVPFILPFVVVVALGLIVASVAWSAAILRGQSDYPRAFGYLSPLVCICIVIFAGLPFHYGQLFLIPMAPNLGSVIFFVVALCLVNKQRT